MKVNLFFNLSVKDKDILKGINDYHKRIGKFTKVTLFNTIDEKLLLNNSYNINVTTKGRYMSSLEFSNIISDNILNRVKNFNIVFNKNTKYDNICFVNFDINEEYLYMMVLEQIYRSYKIINNEPYHK